MNKLLPSLEYPKLAVYLASGSENAPALRQIRDEELYPRGYWVTSHWLEQNDGVRSDTYTAEFKRQCANEDLADIEVSDVFILDLTFDRNSYITHGCMFEAGYAHGQGLDIIVIGTSSLIFWSLSNVHPCNTWAEAIELLEKWGA